MGKQRRRITSSASVDKQIYDLKQLLEISKSLNSSLDFSTLIDALLYTCMGQMKTLGVAIFTRKSFDASCFQMNQNYYGFELSNDFEYSIPEDHSFVKLLSKQNTCFSIDEIKKSSIEIDTPINELISLNPSLVVPLKARTHINGILLLGEQITSEEYSIYDKEHILNIAALASIAINNAALLEMSTTDMMTHLKLKHYFYAVLSEKLEISDDQNSPLSVLMLDIDFFKRFNDTYGHACGDFVLQMVASIIQQNTRTQDMAARYGGEEFVVLLSETELATAKKIAERIRSSIENLDILYDEQHLSLTISIGVAEYNSEVDTSPKKLVERADKALYASKQAGRNRVTVAN
ncbi:GGDEF domain-containing protein [Brucepastera parasyntrophica]|uniref:diguanylate cyclase DgcA n=1 Tax=Brucepastera parasyntrophica TaxID=2880008 RepID=UPI00210CEACF|nr:diguanylate cyclase DgcA [Brucepastera parasyntrophica]ULQ58700.1 GGDEF domain-containing protein [Brucepastera parasyntrophica]